MGENAEHGPSAAAVLDGIEVTLGGERVRITAPTIDASEAWREKLGTIAGEVAQVMVDRADQSDPGGKKLIAAVVALALRNGVGWMRDVVLAYLPEEKRALGPKMTSVEAVRAFRAVLELERDFFGECWHLYKDVMSVSKGETTERA